MIEIMLALSIIAIFIVVFADIIAATGLLLFLKVIVGVVVTIGVLSLVVYSIVKINEKKKESSQRIKENIGLVEENTNELETEKIEEEEEEEEEVQKIKQTILDTKVGNKKAKLKL